jgi:hypothetical protein
MQARALYTALQAHHFFLFKTDANLAERVLDFRAEFTENRKRRIMQKLHVVGQVILYFIKKSTDGVEKKVSIAVCEIHFFTIPQEAIDFVQRLERFVTLALFFKLPACLRKHCTESGYELLNIAHLGIFFLFHFSSSIFYVQVTVNCHYAERTLAWPVATRLYLPQEWADDTERRVKAHVPAEIRFQTKAEIALALVDEANACGVRHACVTCDADYGDNPNFLNGLEEARGALCGGGAGQFQCDARPGKGQPGGAGR